MRNNEIINSVAMMSVLYESFRGDYFDLLMHFVKNILPSDIGIKIDKEELKKRMYEEYGFAPPIAIIEKILKRLAKGNPSTVKASNNEFYINAKIENQQFNERRYRIRERNEKIRTAFVVYANENLGEIITEEKANEQLNSFFEKFGHEIYNGENLDYTIKNSSVNINKSLYGIGRFISYEKGRESNLYNDILEVVKGYLIFNAVYFFFKNTKKNTKSQLNKGTFIFDSSLVLDVLDYHENGTLAKELYKLIKDYKGKVGIFSHTVREIKNILYAYYRNTYEIREQMQITKYKKTGYSNEQILRDIDLIDDRITSFGIKIIESDKINYKEGDSVNNLGLIDEEFLKKLYLERFRYSAPNETGVEHDIRCVSKIARIRKGCHFENLESCPSIFITKNTKLVSACEEMLRSNDRSYIENTINYAMKETDLTAILWLNKYNELDAIPEAILMEKVYAAINPTDELIKKYFDELKMLEDDHAISESAAFTLRTSPNIRERIVIESENAPEEITSQLIIKVYNSFEEEVGKKYVDEAKEEFEKKTQEDKKKREKKLANKATDHAFTQMNKRKKQIKILIGFVALIISALLIYLSISSISTISSKYATLVLAVLVNLPNFDFIFGKGKVIEKLLLKRLERYRINEFDKKFNELNQLIEGMYD